MKTEIIQILYLVVHIGKLVSNNRYYKYDQLYLEQCRITNLILQIDIKLVIRKLHYISKTTDTVQENSYL